MPAQSWVCSEWSHADEMGLGKTAQAISLLARLLDDGDAGPHIVVAPVSTLENWTREIALWCPALTCVKYHGSEAERDEIRQAVKENGTPHVVVCSFTTFSSSGASALTGTTRDWQRSLATAGQPPLAGREALGFVHDGTVLRRPLLVRSPGMVAATVAACIA